MFKKQKRRNMLRLFLLRLYNKIILQRIFSIERFRRRKF